MDRDKASNEIMDLFIRVVNKYNGLEKVPVKHSPGLGLYHSERHMLDMVGVNPHMNMTELARASGVTKGAISQIVKKLETKGVIRRYKKAANDKEVFIELTETGKKICEERRRANEETIKPFREELALHADEHVAFLVHMFQWLDKFMDQAAKTMKSHGPAGE